MTTKNNNLVYLFEYNDSIHLFEYNDSAHLFEYNDSVSVGFVGKVSQSSSNTSTNLNAQPLVAYVIVFGETQLESRAS